MGGTELLKLHYIIIGTLPEHECRTLLENLRGTEEKLCLLEEYEEVEGQDAFSGVLARFPVKQSLLLSGVADELASAIQLGMAAVGYAAPRMDDHVRPELYVEGFEEVDERFLVRAYERHHRIPWTILFTERCVVREFSLDYLDALFELYAGEGMTDYIEPLYPYEEEKRYQEAYIENMYGFYGYGMWIVCEKGTGALIGRVGIECREELDGGLELGYAIGTPYQRQGYATEVCRAVIQYAREEIGASQLHCLIEEGNTVSEHFAGKLGFSYAEDVVVSGKRMKKYVMQG